MKKHKLLLALALVVAALSFSFNAKAQNAEVLLHYQPYNSSEFGYVGFYVTLIDNNTSEYYYLETNPGKMKHGDFYDLGDVPPGNYTVRVQLKSTMITYGYFEWFLWGREEHGYNVEMGIFSETELSNNLEIGTEVLELHIHQ